MYIHIKPHNAGIPLAAGLLSWLVLTKAKGKEWYYEKYVLCVCMHGMCIHRWGLNQPTFTPKPINQ